MMLDSLANYHRWGYQVLYQTIDQLLDESYRKDMGLFFKSIHGTLNHLLLVDKLWLSRFVGNIIKVDRLDQELISDRRQLKAEIDNQAIQWIDFIKILDLTALPEKLDYMNTKDIQSTVSYAKALYHVFNHGTHHRGQISAALTQLGYEAPVMDLIYFKDEA
ncbi:MAG: damage-inducible protein DinB [Gammaproteobacteria bacterium CG11_big_fil_rev_8_21_14_0_20_46_22]|nr:MAG: damage-inducible protein DinB [Gammaproteobacteria bacterium CG12_big_fil_rev_8_21_14_0_65_46_12]PIR10186.1 MAG: damage-inducible protein DinB [Gammaproteobacteria bacterium CG11_big_fil_rev_8_21_14_0_20_46_22]